MGPQGSDQTTTTLQAARPHGAPASVRLPASDAERDSWLAWAEDKLGFPPEGAFDRERAQPLAVYREGKLLAVVVYDHWRAGAVEVQIAAASPRWATRPVIAATLCWPFQKLRVRRITAMVATRNRRSRKLAEGLGFEVEGLMIDGYADDDALIYGMTRAAWSAKWSGK